MLKGTIALDIDGTITGSDQMIPDPVAAYFETLYQEKWRFILVTGRTFSFAMMTLTKLNFPFLLAVQNGADLLKMPEKNQIRQSYLKLDVVQMLDRLYQGEQEDFIIYAGLEKGDFCYYCPQKQSPEMLSYLESLSRLCPEPWQPLETYDDLKQGTFPLIKYIGTKEKCEAIKDRLKENEGIKTSIVKDSVSVSLYIVLITHQEANKGSAVKHLMKTFDLPQPLITAGDDNNDIPLLKVGDLRIAMDGSPEILQNLADIIAPPASRNGIMSGLQEAIERLEK